MNNESGESREIVSELNERLVNGIFKENPTFVLLLGMCPTLAVTTCAVNGLGMGLTTLVVLAMSNLIISALRKVIPSKVRIPAFIVIIASFVTIVEMLLKAYIPNLYDSLGIYIPLIVVNCIILGRAEAYAYSHGPLLSLFDGIGMGMGFTVALTIIGAFREVLGAGTLFSRAVMPESFVPVSIFVMAPGAFFVLAMLTAIQNAIKNAGEKRGHDMSKIQSGCGGNCLECNKECKVNDSLNMPGDDVDVASGEDVSDINLSIDADGEPVVGETVSCNAETADFEENDINSETSETFDDNLSDNSEASGAKSAKRKTSFADRVFGFMNGKKNAVGKDTETDETAENIATDVSADSENEGKNDALDDNLALDADADTASDEEPVSDFAVEESVKGVSDNDADIDGDTAEDTVKQPADNDIGDDDNGETDAAGNAAGDDGDGELELLNLDDYKRAINKTLPSGKRPARKKASFEKAQALFNKASETLKEESEADD